MVQSGEDRSTPDTTTFLLCQQKLARDPAAASETWLTSMGLADQVGESAALLGVGTSAVHALEAFYMFQAHTTRALCLGYYFLRDFHSLPLPGSLWAHVENDTTNSTMQQQTS